MRGILISHILLSQKPDPRRCKSYTLIKICKCVEYFFLILIFFGTPLIMTFSLFDNYLRSMGYLSFFNTLESSCVPFFFFLFFCYFESFMCLSFFSIAPYFFLAYENFEKKDSWQYEWSFYFSWMESMFLRNS